MPIKLIGPTTMVPQPSESRLERCRPHAPRPHSDRTRGGCITQRYQVYLPMEQRHARSPAKPIRPAATDVPRSTLRHAGKPSESAAPLCPPPASAITSIASPYLRGRRRAGSMRVGSKRARSPSSVTTNRAAMAPREVIASFVATPSVGRMTKATARARPAPWLMPRRSGLARGLRSKRCKMKPATARHRPAPLAARSGGRRQRQTRARSSRPASDQPSGPRPRNDASANAASRSMARIMSCLTFPWPRAANANVNASRR